ncbi:ribosome recycling factor family protein [Vibrio sp. SNU_ST1]|uniref:ribosome recycling factor family protein n=1 Tax=Vibrio sp. SNU_ST1 TaxID=3064001 RepID=UPI00272D1EDE|nr:ribosome recycling factor family protein [Vibrio sp. SNU_ST1]WKY60000.1 ribosome recycling factor family protein [Vibrio sp. SNU_ST1]
MFSVPLNSFVHRVSDKSQVMASADECGCQLKRVRRSRNWLLVAQEHQLVEFKMMLTHEKDGWIGIAIDKVLPKPVVCLASLLAATPAMTVAQLVMESGCSMAEARRAIDEHEAL